MGDETELPPAPLATYTLQLFGPEATRSGLSEWLQREIEENTTDLLPEGYSVRIKEWDDEHD